MSRIDLQLIKSISSGRCFLIVGAGASVGLGYPSWKQLAKVVFNSIVKDNPQITKKYGDSWNDLSTDFLLSFFDDVEALVGRETLVSFIQKYFHEVEKKNNRSELYSIITHWPISCYITTNWDREIKRHMPSGSPVFLEKGNTDKDMRTLTADCPNTIFKIHGSFENPDRMIITKKDYRNVLSSPDYSVLREKMYNALSMCPVVIIGYSAQDPDFTEQLERAKSISSLEHPVFMFAPDCSDSFIGEMLVKNNVRIIPYENKDGNHSELLRILRIYNSFISLRDSRLVGRSESQLAKSEESAAFLIYNNTVLKDCSFIAKALANAILNCVREKSLLLEQLLIQLQKKNVSVSMSDVKMALDFLEKEGYLFSNNGLFCITKEGEVLLFDCEQKNKDTKDRFVDYCKTFLLESNNMSETEVNRIVNDINRGLELVFKKRGLEIARNVVNEEDRGIHLSFDILNSFLVSFEDYSDSLFEKYVELLLSILQTPSKAVRDYFAVLCNGYFVYNVLGFGPDIRRKRLQCIIGKDIILDSNFLISLLAKNTSQNDFYVDLLNKVRSINSSIKVTRNLLKEVVGHAFWAITNFSNATMKDFSVYQVEIGLGNVKQNLFIDGAINYCYQTGSLAIESYFEHCFGEYYSSNIEKHIIDVLKEFGISVLGNNDDWDWGDVQQRIELVKQDRIKNESYRSDFQCETEGELLYLSERTPFAFITSALNLQRLDYGHKINHWSPELLYRFFQINDSSIEFDNLYNCMISDLYNCGISVLPKEVMDNCSKLFFEQADLNYEQIKRETSNQTNIFLSPQKIAEAKRDYSYPFLVMQYPNEVIKQLKLERERNQAEKNSIESIKNKNALDEKERILYERMKNSKIARQKKLVNKRKNNKKRKKS